MASFEDLVYGHWNNEVEIARGEYDLLKQVDARRSDALLASPDDGSWSLHNGADV